MAVRSPTRVAIEALYSKHNPEKLGQIDGLVAKYGEPALLKMVQKKYRPAADISVTFTENGSLGLKFTLDKTTGKVQVIGVNPGTQAEKHSQLKPGLTLLAVGATTVLGDQLRLQPEQPQNTR